MAVVTRSGERRIWQYQATLRTGDVTPLIVRVVAQDVTERKRSESRLREVSESLLDKVRESQRTIRDLTLFRTLLDRCNDAIEVVDPQTLRFLDVNEKCCSDLGYSREELLAMTVPDINPASGEWSSAEVTEMARKAGNLLLERVHRRKDGTLFPVEVSLQWLRLDREYVVAIVRDLTERKQAEARLQGSETERKLAEERLREYERVVEGLDEMIVVVDRDYRYLIANRAYLNYRGLEKGQVLGHPVAEMVNREVFETVIKLKLDECFRGKVVRYEIKHSYAAMGERDLFVSYFPIAGPLGVNRAAVILRDVTERKRAEERLREYERVVEGLDEKIVVLDRDRRYVMANRAALIYRGLEKEQLIGREFGQQLLEDGTSKEEIKIFRQRIDECFQGRVVRSETKLSDPKRGEQYLSLSYFPIEGKAGVDRVAVIVQDITERKRAEQALRRSEESYRLFVSQSSEGIFREELDAPIPVDLPEDDLVHHILYDSYMGECNDALAIMYGLSSGREFVGRRLTEMLPPEDPHNLKLTRDYVRSGFRVLDRESHEVDIHGNPKIFLNSMFGIVENGMLLRTWGMQRDITEKVGLEEARRTAEEALRRSEERLRIALSDSPIKVFNQDRDLRYTWVYNLQEGWTEEDYLGKTDEEIFGPENAATMTAIKRPVLETGQGARREFTLNVQGRNYYCDITVEPLRDSAGDVVGVNCACVDISHLREITEELRQAKEKLAEEKLYLEESIDTELGFGEIIGRSSALKEVMAKVAKVAPSDATVLLLGETGTGKELVARALHRQSKRHNDSFIKLNCAAIPSGLLESELFGHEKGAFTGAVTRKIGRLELADQGTLFLDEVGEIPLSLQPKLLRVLQDQEFERLGSTQTLKVNFRLLAATNRNLAQSVKGGEFRSDLYYRLNVFPIVVPPLRERREDVPVLVEHFVRHYAARMNKSITSIPAKTMEALVHWEWPGNIRELENFVERSVILSPGSILQAPLGELNRRGDENDVGTLRDKERERILRTLRECRGQLAGPNGAAARLGMKRTTLQSKLGQLGIKPEAFRK
jgi:PAS domain S-box-containing protein